ncbi:MAG: HEAT repeat domain-containing protein, partial [Verrucomicrobia bacterium]|nr:HEAT repeat domain-containing protein [Verrucomicrobiota bacterium]
PDGALWVVDMYRYLIEHPRWVPPERMAEIDARAGDNAGRIYRVVPRGKKLRPIADLTKFTTPQLVAALNSPNGTARDLVHQQLLLRQDKSAVATLEELAMKATHPAVRVQALCSLDGIGELSRDFLAHALADQDARVRREAIRLAETARMKSPAVIAAMLALVDDADGAVRFQLALSLGEWDDPRATDALARLAKQSFDDGWLRAAIVSSAVPSATELLGSVLQTQSNSKGHAELTAQLISTAAAQAAEKPQSIDKLLAALSLSPGKPVGTVQLAAFSSFLDAYERKLPKGSPSAPSVRELLKSIADTARKTAAKPQETETNREAAVRLLARDASQAEQDFTVLGGLLKPNVSPRLQMAAVNALPRLGDARVAGLFFADWLRHSPSLRTAMLSVLLSRDDWTTALLDAVEKGVVSPGDVPAQSKQSLAQNKNPQLAARAAKLLPATRGSRADVLAKYADVAKLKGDPVKGTAVFDKNCAQCHEMLRGHGFSVGPSLAPLSDKSVQDFLIAILDPNAVIEPRFTAYLVETKDGRSLSGVISGETATSLTVVQPGGLRETVLRTDIASLRASELSLMPEGLEQAITMQEMADLIAFIKAGR